MKLSNWIKGLFSSRPKAKNEKVKFYRRGYFITNNHSATQCTLDGWKGYRYKGTIIAGNKFDKDGFLIDHNLIHKAITKWIEENEMASCEITLKNICYCVGEILVDYGVQLKEIGFEIAPVDHRKLIIGSDGELCPVDGEGELMQAMPAGAEYWCTF